MWIVQTSDVGSAIRRDAAIHPRPCVVQQGVNRRLSKGYHEYYYKSISETCSEPSRIEMKITVLQKGIIKTRYT